MPAPKKALIFDFDGTLADSMPIFRQIYSELAIKNKWRMLSDKDYEVLRRGSLREARRWSGIRLWQYPSLIFAAKRLMHLEAENVKLFEGIEQLITDLHKDGFDLYVLSRNAPTTIDKVLNRYNLSDKISILSRRKRTLGSKAAVIRKLIRRRNYANKYTWMIGDEVRDIQAAKRAGVNSVAVTWGIQDVSILNSFNPDKTVSNVNQLKEYLTS